MEKAPLKYWLIALFFRIFGGARLGRRGWVIGLAAFALVWLTARMAAWAMGALAGLLHRSDARHLHRSVPVHPRRADSGCALLTLFIAVTMWSFLRALDPEETALALVGRAVHGPAWRSVC